MVQRLRSRFRRRSRGCDAVLGATTFVIGAISALGSIGCGGASAADRQQAALQDEIHRVQSDHDRLDHRIGALELGAADDNAKRSAPAKPASARLDPQATPSLRVVHLNADGTETNQASSETAAALNGDDPEDTTARPTIKVAGVAEARGARRRSTPSRDAIEEKFPPSFTSTPNGGTAGPALRTDAPRPSALDPEAKRAYDAALAQVNARRYAEALDAFAAFLIKWPDHPNADNAMYWRGESYFAQGEIARAAEQFEGTIARFPLGNKVPDALLKLGICHQKLGDAPRAKAYFDRLAREFPRSEATRRIPTSAAPEKK
jgi:tol-pal system protein YbgF